MFSADFWTLQSLFSKKYTVNFHEIWRVGKKYSEPQKGVSDFLSFFSF